MIILERLIVNFELKWAKVTKSFLVMLRKAISFLDTLPYQIRRFYPAIITTTAFPSFNQATSQVFILVYKHHFFSHIGWVIRASI
jgi:hypothetical protein